MMRQLESTMQLQKMIQDIFWVHQMGTALSEQRSGSNRLKDLSFFTIVIVCTLQEINLSHLGKRKIILKYAYQGDMLIPWRVIVNYFALGVLLNEFQTRSPLLLAF